MADPKKIQQQYKKYEELCEAAFDDNVEEVNSILADKTGVPIDPLPEFPEGTYSALSEAAAGNAVNVAKLLLGRGADPNQRGQYGRTPLFRACFNEHVEVIPVLLNGGADPRHLLPRVEVGDDGEQEGAEQEERKKKMVLRDWDPEEFSGPECVKSILRKWDMSTTLRLLRRREEAAREQEKFEEASLQAKKEEFQSNEEKKACEVDEATKAWEKALATRESRIKEFDNAKCEGEDRKAEVLIPLIKEAEEEVERLRKRKETLETELHRIRGQIRKCQAEEQGGIKYNQQARLAQVADLVQDSAGELAEKGKCALLVDPAGVARSFLQYRDVVLLDLGTHTDVMPEKLRASLLGAIRQGRPLVLNVGELGEESLVAKVFDEVHHGLYQELKCGKLTENEGYEKLITKSLAGEFKKNTFPPEKAARFKFVLLSKCEHPDPALLDGYFSIRVVS